MATDHSAMRLGKKTPKLDERTLRLSRYLKLAELPPPPESQDWTHGITDWGVMKNADIGDCTCAAAGHLIMDWTANVGDEVIPSDDDIVTAYSAVSGYDPATGLNDNGAVELDVLNYWRTTGIAGHKIQAYATLDVANQDYVKASVVLFGGCYIGLALPLTAQTQDVWDVVHESVWSKMEQFFGIDDPSTPGSWGGHAVPIVGYNPTGPVCITWGAPKQLTWSFWGRYCDECYAILSPDWLNANQVDPAGVDLATLESDLATVTAAPQASVASSTPIAG
jgi:hypothetical protein